MMKTAIIAVIVAFGMVFTGSVNAWAATEAGYHMDEAAGADVARDFTGHGHNGALHNVITGVTGKTNKAFKFNGVDSYMRVPNTASLKPGTRAVTVSVWLKTTGCKQIDPLDCDIVKYGAAGDPDPAGEVKVELMHDGTLVCGFIGTNNHYNLKVSGTNVANGAWHRLVCKKTATSVSLLLDGTQRGTKAITIGAINPVRDLFVGSDNSVGPAGDWYNGLLDELTISYN